MTRLCIICRTFSMAALPSSLHLRRDACQTLWVPKTRFPTILGRKHFSSPASLKIQQRLYGEETANKKKRFNKWTVAIFGCMCAGIIAEETFSPHSNGIYKRLFDASSEPILEVFKFKPFMLVSREVVSGSLDIFKLVPSSHSHKNKEYDPYQEYWDQGIWSVEFKQPQLQIARRYTPLPPWDAADGQNPPNGLSFLIRREHAGEVSRYLHNLMPGTEIEVRGAYLEYELPSDVDQVIFLAGGTGIAPALQVAHVFEQRARTQDKSISMHLLWANRSREECKGGVDFPREVSTRRTLGGSWLFGLWGAAKPSDATTTFPSIEEAVGPLVSRLEALQTSGSSNSSLHLKTSYFVDEEGTFIKKESITNAINAMSREQEKVLASGSSDNDKKKKKKLILISGPDGFVEYTAGAKTLWRGIEYQGPIGGLLAKIDHADWQIHKL